MTSEGRVEDNGRDSEREGATVSSQYVGTAARVLISIKADDICSKLMDAAGEDAVATSVAEHLSCRAPQKYLKEKDIERNIEGQEELE